MLWRLQSIVQACVSVIVYVFVSVYMCVRVCLCIFLCVCVRERERVLCMCFRLCETESDRVWEIVMERVWEYWTAIKRERETERKREIMRVRGEECECQRLHRL